MFSAPGHIGTGPHTESFCGCVPRRRVVWLKGNSMVLRALWISRTDNLFKSCNDHFYSSADRHESVCECIVASAAQWTLIDRYVYAEIGICLDVHARSVPVYLEARNLCFILQESWFSDHHAGETCAKWQADLGGGIGRDGADNVQSAVAVFPRPVVQNPKTTIEVENPEVRSEFWRVVRLYFLNECPTFLRERGNVSSCVPKFLNGGADGELQALLVRRTMPATLKGGGFIHSPIKGRPELVEHLAQHERQVSGHGPGWTDQDSPGAVIVYAYDSDIGVVFDETVPNIGKSLAVTFCPFDTLPRSFEWLHRSG